MNIHTMDCVTRWRRILAAGLLAGAAIAAQPALAGSLSVVASFPGGSAAPGSPQDPLIDVGGILYGTSRDGGANAGTGSSSFGDGTLYSVNPADPAAGIDVLANFNGTDGIAPNGQLAAIGGTIIGATANGGANDYNPGQGRGTIYAFNTKTPAAGVRTLANFGGSPTALFGPWSGLTLDPTTQTVYGSALYGGNGAGGLFSYNSATGLQTFGLFGSTPTSGAAPVGSLAMVDGVLYGTTQNGGTHNYAVTGSIGGTLFSYDLSTGTKTIIDNFSTTDALGGYPQSGVVSAGGMIYGTTIMNGAGDHGVLFGYNPQDPGAGVQALADFTGANGIGAFPEGNLVDVKGVLYGVTMSGGDGTYSNQYYSQAGVGTLFSYAPGTGLKTLANFDTTTGAFPQGGLTYDNGVVYGTTSQGGANDTGTVFAYDLAAATTIPEPGTLLLLGSALIMLGVVLRHWSRR